jgi:hypothetical protein
MDLPSSSDKKAPIPLDPEDGAIPDLSTGPSKRSDFLRFLKLKKQTMTKFRNKESSNTRPSPRTFRVELLTL